MAIVDTSTWDWSLAKQYQHFTEHIDKMSPEWLQTRIEVATRDAADPVLQGEAEWCAAIISAAQAELARRV